MRSPSYYNQKKVAEDVYIVDSIIADSLKVYHRCPDGGEMSEMTLRENEDGPLYWCGGCGYTLEEGLSMAVRLNEVNI